MGEVVSFVGQKGGTGKSTLARGFAVEAARLNLSVVLADLDDAQRTSFEWGQRRVANGFEPRVAVERVSRLQVFTRAAAVDVLIVDAPGWADASTAWLAQGSQLTVLPTGAGVDDLNPTIRLIHELRAKDVPDWRTAIALCRVHNDAEAAFARDYLKQVKFTALPGELRERKSYSDVQNLGQAITECAIPAIAREAREMVDGIAKALERSVKRQQQIEREAGPPRLVERDDERSR
jgi:chromosome partitioning protein